MKKTMAVVTVILFLAVAVSPVLAQRGWGPGAGRGVGSGPCGYPSALNLKLTTEQQAKLNDLRVSHLKEVKPLRDKMYSLRGDLRLLWLEKNPDPAKIAEVQKEIRSLRDQIHDKGTAYRLEANKILTPEQQAQFNSFCPGGGFGPGYGRGGRGGGFGPGYGPGYGHGGMMRDNW